VAVWASNLAYFGFVRLTHISNNVLTIAVGAIAVGAINVKYANPILGGTGWTFAGMDLVLYSFAREFPCLRSRPFPSPATLPKLFRAFFFQHRLAAGGGEMWMPCYPEQTYRNLVSPTQAGQRRCFRLSRVLCLDCK
jgi:hypothetical protein